MTETTLTEHLMSSDIDKTRKESGGGLSFVDILVVVSQLPGQLVDNFFEDDRVNVLAKHVEEEPVAHLGLLDDDVDTFLLDQSESDVEDVSL